MAGKQKYQWIKEYDDGKEVHYRYTGKHKRLVLLDKEDEWVLTNYSWTISLNSSGHYRLVNSLRSRAYQEFKAYQFTHAIMGRPKEAVVDHINGNTLDNRKCNLQLISSINNRRKAGLRKNNSSGHPGIRWNKAARKWYTYITCGLNRIHLGSFDSLEEAIKVRDEAAIKYFGDFAMTKEGLENYQKNAT